MRIIKVIVSLTIIFFLLTSCSIINRVKEKLSKKENDKKEVTTNDTKEITKSNGENDLKFYNTYIDVVNKMSTTTESLQKDYLSEIPDPKSLRKNSLVLVVSASFELSSLETLIKQYKRSYYDNGDLAKMISDNEDMKREIESDFKTTLSALDEYYNTAKKVIDYFQNKDYQSDLSKATGYDEEMKESFKKYLEAFNKFNDTVKKYKPQKVFRNPDDYVDPDEKAVAILLNTYENTLEKAEAFYDKFENFKQGNDPVPISLSINELENSFNTDKNAVESAPFTDKTKYMKYSFEDYFTRTVNDFLKQSRKFIDKIKASKTGDKKFTDGYNDVVRYYNYMIDSYNSSIGTVNSYKSY